MSNVLEIIIATAMAYAGGILGVLLSPAFLAKRLRELVVAAMGALVAVTVLDVLPEAKEALSWPWFLVAVASGFGLFWLIGTKVAPVCPACAYNELGDTEDKRVTVTVSLLLAALTIHSLFDGLAVAVGHEIRRAGDLGLLFGISFHKLPEGLALAVLLLGVGYGRGRALLTTILVESSTIAGGLLGIFLLGRVSPVLLSLVFANVGGGFLYLIASASGAIHSAGVPLIGGVEVGSEPGRLVPADAPAAHADSSVHPPIAERRTERIYGRWPVAISGCLAFLITAGLISAVKRYVP